jgi:hypothetical protein
MSDDSIVAHEMTSRIRQSPSLSNITAAHNATAPQNPSSLGTIGGEDIFTHHTTQPPEEQLNENTTVSKVESCSEESGGEQKSSPVFEDPFGNEEGAEVKYKTMTWL